MAKKEPWTRRKWGGAPWWGWTLIALGTVAAITVIVVGANRPYPVATSDSVPMTTTSTVATPQNRVQIKTAMARLNDHSHEFTVLVLGDSTGAARSGWVTQLAQQLGSSTGRQSIVHPWSVEAQPDGYQTQWNVTQGATPGVTVWNGSASGQNMAYTTAHLREMAPMEPSSVDLILINHGHNEGAGYAGRAAALAADLAAEFPNAAIAAIVQNPERPGSTHADVQDANMAALNSAMTQARFPTIDVYTSYKQIPGWQSAFDTPTGSLHPNQEGYDAWASVVEDALGISSR